MYRRIRVIFGDIQKKSSLYGRPLPTCDAALLTDTSAISNNANVGMRITSSCCPNAGFPTSRPVDAFIPTIASVHTVQITYPVKVSYETNQSAAGMVFIQTVVEYSDVCGA